MARMARMGQGQRVVVYWVNDIRRMTMFWFCDVILTGFAWAVMATGTGRLMVMI